LNKTRLGDGVGTESGVGHLAKARTSHDKREPYVFPAIDTPAEYPHVLVSLFCVFYCLTGSGGFLVSGTVEDDLLVL